MLKEVKTRPVVAPHPVLIIGTYDNDGNPDAMNVAWGGQCWDKQIAINISSSHKTIENIRLKKCFTVHIGDEERVALADYVGIVSGHDEEKMRRVHASAKRGNIVDAPIIQEFVLAMECKLVSITDNGDEGVRIVGEVVRTVADDSVIDDKGRIDYSRLRPIVFDSEHNVYRGLGPEIAKAFQVGKELK